MTAPALHPCRLRTFPREAPAEPALWFLILTYNALAYTKRCLLSLDRTTPVPWRALVLDNGSTDGTRAWLTSLGDPRIRVEFAERNLGVAGGRNRQLALLGSDVAEDALLVFVDNDLEFFGDWSAPFREAFAANPRLGIASAAGYEVAVHGCRRDLLPRFTDRPQPVDVAAGGFACTIRPAVFREIGPFDEALGPFWHEDDDIAVRARAADWEVLAIPSPGIIHHGHKSGSALPDLSRGGSHEKQRYLVEKWRRAGLVTTDGRLAFASPGPDAERRARIASHMGRPGPLRHAEFDRALADVHALQRSWCATRSMDAAVRFASAPARALLADLVAHPMAGLEEADTPALCDAVDALLQRRRRMTRLPAPAPAADGGPSPRSSAAAVLADVRDWEDDAWFARAADLAGDARGRQQWYARTLATWRSAQAASLLARTLGEPCVGQSVLFVGPVRERLVWGLAAAGVAVTVADLPPSNGVDPRAWAASPERHAWREVPRGAVRRVPFDRLREHAPPAAFDALVHLPWVETLAPDALRAVLEAGLPHVRAGAPVIATVVTRLAGPPSSDVLDGPTSLERLLARVTLRVAAGGVDPSLSDDALLSATATDPDGVSRPRTPDLLVADGARLLGHLCFVAHHA